MATALIDGDLLVYEAASAAEKPIDWGNGLWTLHSEEDDAVRRLRERLHGIMQKIDCEEIVFTLSDKVNFRKEVLPTYKANRADKRKPMLLPFLRQYVQDNWKTFIRPSLEADDVLGILMTHPTLIEGGKVCVSLDKDLKTIPGSHFNYNRDEAFTVDEQTADYWHLYQTLIGDTTDNYSGCPGIGPKKAEVILKPMQDGNPGWPLVASTFAKAGLSEDVALQQARVARICRASDYDFKKKEVKLWNPN
jgi:DNA polymerase I